MAASGRPRRGDPAIAKRKPPSQRVERQLDATALAIAQAREQEKTEKAADTPKSGGSGVPPVASRPGRSLGRLINNSATPAAVRPKKKSI